MADAGANIDQVALDLARREIEAHPAVAVCGEFVPTARGLSLTVELALNYGALWTARGSSPTGVRPNEEVRFDFPAAYPAQEPKFSLRPDFSPNHPHFQHKGTPDGRPVPCVIEGSVGEFIAANGYYPLIDQIVAWLNGAAEDRLMDGGRAWEPGRRDRYGDIIVANAEGLRALVDRDGGFKFFQSHFRCLGPIPGEFTPLFHGRVGEPVSMKGPPLTQDPAEPGKFYRGEGLVVALWAGKHANGKSIICDKWLSEDISTAAELFQRAKDFAVEDQLNAALGLLQTRAADKKPVTFPLVVLMLVRRPRRVVGSTSNIEICGYVTPLEFPHGALTDPTKPVRSLTQLDEVEPGLLRDMSGDPELSPWALLGCGSLGSKIALHCARSGNAPTLVGDKGYMSPHNAARHGLYPSVEDVQSGWLAAKAEKLTTTLSSFGRPVAGIVGDQVALGAEIAKAKKALRPAWFVNATASLVVRESLARPEAASFPPVAEFSLFDGGKLGYAGIEGKAHNPNSVELVATLYQMASTDPAIGKHLFRPDNAVNRVTIGQGCGSQTMTVSDASLSVVAGGMAELFTSLGKPDRGALHLFRRIGLGMDHVAQPVPAFVRVDLEGMEGWSVSIAKDVHAWMLAETARYPTTETGGVIVGWSSTLARHVVVTDLIDAPADSRRSATEFVLGKEGLRDRLATIAAASNGLLRPLGTWHSHLGSAHPSGKDHRTARIVGAADIQSTALIIVGTDGLRAISAPPTGGTEAVAERRARRA